VYNERATIASVIDAVRHAPIALDKEIIVVDDGSQDGTRETIAALSGITVRALPHNQGKGAAVREGIKHASGDFILIQDADLEYTPNDYPALLAPLLGGKADVVFGTRFLGGGAHRVHLFWHSLGNNFLTLLSNMMTNLNLTDMEVGYKVFRADIIKNITLEQNRFGFEPEITAKIAKLKCRVYEVPISYYGRAYDEGKKINWKDGIAALWCIFKYWFVR
jgi:glycosyltransferase involved in cell wall biosynthesis